MNQQTAAIRSSEELKQHTGSIESAHSEILSSGRVIGGFPNRLDLVELAAVRHGLLRGNLREAPTSRWIHHSAPGAHERLQIILLLSADGLGVQVQDQASPSQTARVQTPRRGRPRRAMHN